MLKHQYIRRPPGFGPGGAAPGRAGLTFPLALRFRNCLPLPSCLPAPPSQAFQAAESPLSTFSRSSQDFQAARLSGDLGASKLLLGTFPYFSFYRNLQGPHLRGRGPLPDPLKPSKISKLFLGTLRSTGDPTWPRTTPIKLSPPSRNIAIFSAGVVS